MRSLLIGCVAFLLVIALSAFFVARWVKTRGVAKADAMQAEGATFGRKATESACLTEGMARYAKNTGVVGGMAQMLWLGGCLETSKLDADFCDGVPSPAEMGPSVVWRVAKCQELGLGGDARCSNILGQVQTYCAGDMRKTKVPEVVAAAPVATGTYERRPVVRTPVEEKPLFEIAAAPVAEQVYVDNKTKLFYAEKCTTRPPNAYRMARKLAVMQGFKEAKCR